MPARVYRGLSPDQLKLTLNSSGNDYTEATYKRISRNVVRDTFTAVRKANAKSNLIFTKFITEAQEIVEGLNNIGVPAGIVTGDMKPDDRESMIERFTRGDIKALANVGVLTVGFDHPALDHIVLARPTNSARLYYQMLGRGIRIHPSKNKCILTDLCGNVDRMGKIENWQIRDNNGDKAYRLYNDNRPLTGIDLKRDIDIEKGSNISQNETEIHFGKHKGTKICDAPTDYLQWIVGNFSPGEFRSIAKDEIARRAAHNV